MLKLFFFTYILFLTIAAEENKLSEKIYISLDGLSACYLRLNRNGMVGCKGAESAVGTLFYIDREDSWNWFKNKANQGPYTLLINPSDEFPFDLDRMKEIKSLIVNKKVNSLLLTYYENSAVDHFSPEATCPNHKYDFYSNRVNFANCSDYVWNVNGTNWLNEYFEIPILALYKEDQIAKLLDICWEKRNKPKNNKFPDSPLCAVEIKSQMRGAVNAEVCLRRTGKTTNLNGESKELCTIISAKTIISSYPAFVQEKKVILVLAQYLTLTMFETLAPGANNPLSGMITLLAVSKALKAIEGDISRKGKSIVFMLLGGETLDYLSSTRIIFDMKHGNFFLNPSQIELIVEISQVASVNEKLYMHTNKINQTSEIKKANIRIMKVFEKFSEKINFTEASREVLPPASFQSFLKLKPYPGIVLADHDKTFENRFYNSRYDTLKKELSHIPSNATFIKNTFPLARKLTQISKVIAESLYNLATEETLNISIDEIYVANLLFCLLKNNSCDLLKEVAPFEFNLTAGYGDKPTWTRDWHLSVQQSISRKTNSERLVLSLLANATGHISNNITEERVCNSYKVENKTGLWIKGYGNSTKEGMCIISGVKDHSGLSPGYDPSKNEVLDNEYPVWTESTWLDINVRYFLKPNSKTELAVLLSGIIVFGVSLVGSFFLSKRSHLLFENRSTGSL